MYCSVSPAISRRCLIVRNTQCKKAAELSLSRGLTPSFHVIFHVICLSNRNEDVKRRKISLEIFQENVYDGVSFNKVTNLQCSDCNFAIKITHHRYFFENVPTQAVLKNRILRKPDVEPAS